MTQIRYENGIQLKKSNLITFVAKKKYETV